VGESDFGVDESLAPARNACVENLPWLYGDCFEELGSFVSSGENPFKNFRWLCRICSIGLTWSNVGVLFMEEETSVSELSVSR
jgi:hypothetical protein